MPKKQFSCLWSNTANAVIRSKVFTRDELAFIFCATACLTYRDSIIRNPDGDPASREDLVLMLGCSLATVRRLLALLKMKNAIEYDGQHYRLNPALGWKGKEHDQEYGEEVERFKRGYIKSKNIERKTGSSPNPESIVVTDKFGHRIPILRGVTHDPGEGHQ